MAGSLGTAAVMGAGAWGTAIAKVRPTRAVTCGYGRVPRQVADEINSTRRNTGYLGDVELPSNVHATTDAAEALAGVTTVLLAVPSQTLRDELEMGAAGRTGRHPGQPGQGHRTGHADADEPVIGQVAGVDRSRSRCFPGQSGQ